MKGGERRKKNGGAPSPSFLALTFSRRVRLKHPVRRPPGLGVGLQFEEQVPARKVGGALEMERARCKAGAPKELVMRF